MSDRLSGSNQARVTTRPIATIQHRRRPAAKMVRCDALTPAQIDGILLKVRLALQDCDPLRAKRAIENAFYMNEKPEVIDGETHISALGMRLDTAGFLEKEGIVSVADLVAAVRAGKLEAIHFFGKARVRDVHEALDRIGAITEGNA